MPTPHALGAVTKLLEYIGAEGTNFDVVFDNEGIAAVNI